MKCPCGGKLLYFGAVTSLVVVYRCTECGRDTYKSYGEKPVHEVRQGESHGKESLHR